MDVVVKIEEALKDESILGNIGSATKSSSAGKVDRKGTVYSADDSGRRQEYLISAIVPKKIKQEHIASKIILTAA